MTTTEEMLLAKYGEVIRLEVICEVYFGVGIKSARQLAALNLLPIATFRARASAKAPLLVRAADLAAHVDDAADKAQRSWLRSQI